MATIAVMAAAVVGACGDEKDPAADRQDVEAVVLAMQRDFRSGDLRGVCDAMSPEAHTQIGKAGHGIPSGCVADFREMLDLVRQTLRDENPAVKRVEVDGDEATAVLAVNGRPTTAIPLERHDGEWKVVNFFGADTAPPKIVYATPDERATYPVRPAIAPLPAGEPVSTSGKDGGCGDVRVRGEGLAGGCVGRVRGGTLDMVVRTPIGGMPMSTQPCIPKGSMRVSGDGRVWIDDVTLQEPERLNPCADNKACSAEGAEDAWQGEIRAGSPDRLVGDLNVCVATCVGRFKGKVPFDMRRAADGWRIRFDASPLANGGMTFDGVATTAGMQGVKFAPNNP